MYAQRLYNSQNGFTLVELLVVVGIIAIISALAVVNLGQVQTGAGLSTTVNTLLSDLKSQQLLAMVGDVGSTNAQQPHGIFVQSGQYTLFAANTFSVGDSNNYVVSAPQNINFSSSFSGGTVLFIKGSGSVNGYTAGSNTITVTRGSTSQTITLNRLGAITVN